MRRDFPLALPEDGSEAEVTAGISVCDVTAVRFMGDIIVLKRSLNE